MAVGAGLIWDAAYTTVGLIKSYLGTDAKVDSPPSKSSVYDIRADDWNKKVAGLADVALRTRPGMLVVHRYSHPNVTAGGTAVDLYRGGGGDTGLLLAVMPWGGRIVGIGARCENARTAGSCVVNVEITAVQAALAVTIDAANPLRVYTSQLPAAAPSNDQFAAAAEIGVTYTTDGSWAAGATPSLDVDVYLAMGD